LWKAVNCHAVMNRLIPTNYKTLASNLTRKAFDRSGHLVDLTLRVKEQTTQVFAGATQGEGFHLNTTTPIQSRLLSLFASFNKHDFTGKFSLRIIWYVRRDDVDPYRTPIV